jgi:hypothetical protein
MSKRLEFDASSSDVWTSGSGASMMSGMRTALTLDDDLAGLLNPAPKTIPHSFGFRPGIDLYKLGQLTDELEAEAFADNAHDSALRKRSRSRAKR